MLNMSTSLQQVKKIKRSFNQLPKELFALEGDTFVQVVDCAYVKGKAQCEVLSWAAQEYLGALVVESYRPEMDAYIQQSKNIEVMALDVAMR
jgi:hypothetical protein